MIAEEPSYHRNERRSRIQGAVLSLLVSALVFLVIFFYRFTKVLTEQKTEVLTTLIHFRVDQNTQSNEHSSSGGVQPPLNPELKPKGSKLEEKLLPNRAKNTPKIQEKLIEGNSAEVSLEKAGEQSLEDLEQAPEDVFEQKESKVDQEGLDAIENIIRGKGAVKQTGGDTQEAENSGKLDGEPEKIESEIGKDRMLVSFIPGTMGRGGEKPPHHCTASGNITLSYIVDRAGNVISVKQVGGISDPCIVQTAVKWIREYVKAEKSEVFSVGSYKILF